MSRKCQMSKGFTLVEILVAMAIIISAATAVTVLLASSFRVSNKTTSIEAVRQSGNSALSQITKTIQFADHFVGVSQNGSTYYSSCPPPPNPTLYYHVRVKSGDYVKRFTCGGGGNLYINENDLGGGNNQALIDTAKVNITSCQFTCSQNNQNVAPVIGVNYTLSLQSASSVPEKNASMTFSTGVKMRNL